MKLIAASCQPAAARSACAAAQELGNRSYLILEGKPEESRQLARDRDLAAAAAMIETYTKSAQGFRERTDALVARGAPAVRSALVEKLASIQFELVPFDREENEKGGAQIGRAHV